MKSAQHRAAWRRKTKSQLTPELTPEITRRSHTPAKQSRDASTMTLPRAQGRLWRTTAVFGLHSPQLMQQEGERMQSRHPALALASLFRCACALVLLMV